MLIFCQKLEKKIEMKISDNDIDRWTNTYIDDNGGLQICYLELGPLQVFGRRDCET
jgi:hypothetical protein